MFACVYIPNFPAEAVVRTQPELREQAAAVVEGTPPLAHVIACNERARQLGVEPGMTKTQAEERMGESGVRRRSPQQEAAAHAALLDCACGFSPRVEDTAADMVILDIGGLGRAFGTPPKIARDLAQRASEMGLEANVAVAGNPDAAMLAARGFPGVTVIAEGQEGKRLGALPVDVLHPSSELLETFDRWGVRNLRGLAVLPEVAISERLGQEGLRLQRLAQGATMRALLIAEPVLNFEERLELEYPVDLLEPLAFLLSRMLEQLCARLQARALATNDLRLRLQLDSNDDIQVEDCQILIQYAGNDSNSAIRQYENPVIHERRLRLPLPMLDAKVFLKLLQLDLQAHPPAAPVTKIWLRAEVAEPRRTQNGLFLPLSPEAEKLELTLARIEAAVNRQSQGKNSLARHRDGEDSAIRQSGNPKIPRVGAAELVNTHQPGAFRMQRFTPPAAMRQGSKAASPGCTNSVKPTTALRVFRPPLRVRMEISEGVPAHVGCAERPTLRGEVMWCAGPWRGSGEWWSGEVWARDEWDIAVRNENGTTLYRAYREAGGAWFLEGSYD